ncbi:molybdopterin biosynthesis protein MoeB [compost metagenome]
MDVRGTGPYGQEHIAGALSIPNHELSSALGKLPRESAIVCYCSCPNDHLSLVAAGKLIKQHGYPRAYALEGGLPRWKQLGYPLVTSARP